MAKPILSVDFDGVLHSYSSGWLGATNIPDPPVHGAMQWLKTVSDSFDVNIYSSRSHVAGGIDAMQAWLARWATHENGGVEPLWLQKIVFPEHKPSAFLIIDDRAFRFEGRWPSVTEMFNTQPWYKKRKGSGTVELVAENALRFIRYEVQEAEYQRTLIEVVDLLRSWRVE